MSLEALVQQAGRALGAARELYGQDPAPGAWGATGATGGARDTVAQAGGAAAWDWQGHGGPQYVSDITNHLSALDSVSGADSTTGAGFDASAAAARDGGAGMDTVIDDTRTLVAAIAPSTDTPAGKAALVAHLQHQLLRAKALLRVSEARNIELATMIRGAAAGYRPTGATGPTPGTAGMGGTPTRSAPMMGAGPAAALTGLGIPNLAQLAHQPTHHHALPTPHGTASPGIPLGGLTENSTPAEVAAAVIHEAHRRGYSPAQTIAILSTMLQESGGNPHAVHPNGLWRGVFQQDSSYPGRDNPNTAIAEFFDRLDQKGGPSSPDIWKSIFWLQQRPGEPSADAAFSHGRQAYLSEIQSQLDRATTMYHEIVGVLKIGGHTDRRIFPLTRANVG